MIFQKNIPTNLRSIYNSKSYFIKETFFPEEQQGYIDYISYGSYLEEHFEEQIIELEKYAKKGKLLDVGCALGFFMKVANKRGWESTGIDVAKFAVEYSKKEFNLNVLLGELKDCNFKSDYFAVIVLNDFLEHINNPHEVMKEVHRILKEDGVIIINSPNTDSLSFRILGRYWLHTRQMEHLILFNYKSIKYLLDSIGFKILKYKIGSKVTDINIISERFRFYNKFLQKIFQKVINITGIEKFKFKLRTGEMMVYARKLGGK